MKHHPGRGIDMKNHCGKKDMKNHLGKSYRKTILKKKHEKSSWTKEKLYEEKNLEKNI